MTRPTSIINRPYAVSSATSLGGSGGSIGGGTPAGGTVPTASGSNGWVWSPNIGTIEEAGAYVVGPDVKLSAGSNMDIAVTSNTIIFNASGGGSVSYGSNSNAVGSAGAAGAATEVSRTDHVHQGVHQVTSNSSNARFEDINLVAGTGIALGVSGQSVTIVNTGVPGPAGSGGGGGGWTLIEDEVLGSAATEIIVTGIPTTYDDLLVIAYLRSDAVAQYLDTWMRVGAGSTSSTDYGNTTHYWGSASGSVNNAATTRIYVGPLTADSATAGYFATVRLEIFDYASTSIAKNMVGQAYSPSTSTFRMEIGGSWKTVASAIDRVQFHPNSGNFKAGSRLLVYGR